MKFPTELLLQYRPPFSMLAIMVGEAITVNHHLGFPSEVRFRDFLIVAELGSSGVIKGTIATRISEGVVFLVVPQMTL